MENLMRTELHDVSLWSDEERPRPFGIFDDALPTRQELISLGLSVTDDYDPETHRSFEASDGDLGLDNPPGD
ncbi:hypothetical protein [Nocardioides sp. URHA0020]|uniref:hypothetical protein n=1 Tax=Nocardioides sp. URHA0020 TaxID=1380392 RepID=UPI0012DDC6E9|nr:hypothetical protein [Nocardioides sp. URHA0020]